MVVHASTRVEREFRGTTPLILEHTPLISFDPIG